MYACKLTCKTLFLFFRNFYEKINWSGLGLSLQNLFQWYLDLSQEVQEKQTRCYWTLKAEGSLWVLGRIQYLRKCLFKYNRHNSKTGQYISFVKVSEALGGKSGEPLQSNGV